MKIKVNRQYSFFALSIWLLSFQGFFNYLAAGGLAAAWKQAITTLLLASSLLLLKNRKTEQSLIITGATGLILIFYSTTQGLSLSHTIFNLFFYISWIPFYIFAKNGGGVYFSNNYNNKILLFVVASSVGLYIDLTTDIFSFLWNSEIDNSYLEDRNIAKRAAFIFNASTTVMPILCGLSTLWIIKKQKESALWLMTTALLISSYCTASLSAAIMFMFFLAAAIANSQTKLKTKLLILSAAIIIIFIAIQTYSGGIIQIDRIIQNNSQSVSNQGRINLWLYALNQISEFSPIELFVGKGIGVTNTRFGFDALYLHGESSYFQAYIEGGLIGTTVRILPFILYFVYFRHKLTTDLYMISLFIGTAVAPIYGNITLQAILGLLVGTCAHLKYNSELQSSPLQKSRKNPCF